MLDHLIHPRLAPLSKCPQAQQPQVISQISREHSLISRLPRQSADAGDFDESSAIANFPFANRLRAQSKHRFEQTYFRIAYRELRRVHSYGYAAGSRVAIVSGQSALPALIHFSVFIERERMRRDHNSLVQSISHLGCYRHQNLPSMTSNLVGLLRLAPPISTQCATISINFPRVTSG